MSSLTIDALLRRSDTPHSKPQTPLRRSHIALFTALCALATEHLTDSSRSPTPARRSRPILSSQIASLSLRLFNPRDEIQISPGTSTSATRNPVLLGAGGHSQPLRSAPSAASRYDLSVSAAEHQSPLLLNICSLLHRSRDRIGSLRFYTTPRSTN